MFVRHGVIALLLLGSVAGAHLFGQTGQTSRYFCRDTTGLRSLVKGAWRTMGAVFERAGVQGPQPHRFRHALGSELLEKGAG
jgi:site-specific recombinase XerD